MAFDPAQIQMSRTDGPTRTAIHSVEGWGKTTLLAHFPAPIFLGAEKGIPRDLGFDVQITTPESWLDVFAFIDWLIVGDHDRQTLCIDTADWLEPLIHRFVCDRDTKRKTELNPKGHELISIEDYGYGKGFLAAEEEFRKLINALDALQARRNIHIAIAMHSKLRTFENVFGSNYDRYEGKCHARITRLIVEYAENVLFGFFDIVAAKNPDDVARNEDGAKAKAIDGDRQIGARNSPQYDAKNRIGLPDRFTYGDPRRLVDRIVSGMSAERIAATANLHAATRREPAPQRELEPQREPASSAPAGATSRSAARDEDRGDDYRGAQSKPAGGRGRDEGHPNAPRDERREPQRDPRNDAPPPQRASARADTEWSNAPANGNGRNAPAKREPTIEERVAELEKHVLDRAKSLGKQMHTNVIDWCERARTEPPENRDQSQLDAAFDRLEVIRQYLVDQTPNNGNNAPARA